MGYMEHGANECALEYADSTYYTSQPFSCYSSSIYTATAELYCLVVKTKELTICVGDVYNSFFSAAVCMCIV